MSEGFERLCAKSHSAREQFRPSMLLQQHLQDVYVAAERVLRSTADDQLLAVGLLPDEYRVRLQRCTLVGAAIHDIGKANDHFQGMIWGQRDVRENPQGLRHEWVTVLLLQSLREWLLPTVAKSDTDFLFVEWTVAGHHPSCRNPSPPTEWPAGAGAEMQILWDHNDFRSILNWLAETFELGPIPSLHGYGPICGRTVTRELGAWSRASRQLFEGQIRNSPDAKFVAVLKDCLISADVAGSALPKVIQNEPTRWNWISESFDNRPAPGDLRKIVERRLYGHAPRQFQSLVASSASPVTFVKAGCGTGKTLAAYMWAAQNHPTRRLYFCYPTTGTATEGFKDYLYEPENELGGIGARLFHSRSDVDFETILNTGADCERPDHDAMAGLESLQSWSTPIVACTVDTVLGIIQNNRRGTFSWPALAQSAFIFDEIHAYDDRLFGALLRFLRDLAGLPALLMTASLSVPRKNALREVLQKFRNIELAPIAGPQDLEELPRYRRQLAGDIDLSDLIPIIRDELRAGGKVLWVCNTVGRVMEAADRAAQFSPRLYHSRFKYIDRVDRHKEVVGLFTPGYCEPALAICSQVAEMSLDLRGCTLLVTDLAPVPALIQRLGRLNRQAVPGCKTAPVVIVEPKNHLPYNPTDLEYAREWLAALPADEISQRTLAEAWEQCDDEPPDPVDSAWFDGGPRTTVTELREASLGITVLMEEDLPRITTTKDIGRYAVPMPTPPRGWQNWRRERGVPIAPTGSIAYDSLRGARWQNTD